MIHMKLTLPSPPFRRSRRPSRSRGPGEETSVPADLVLPVELWDHVFCEVAYKDLLRLAVVCRLFNTLCIGIYLTRYENSAQSLASGKLFISSPTHTIRALRLSCDTPQIIQLVCRIWPARQELASLQAILQKFNTLRELSVTFLGSRNLVDILRYEDRSDLLHSFCGVLSIMASKTPGPVSVIAGERSRSRATWFSCRTKDIAGWRLDGFGVFQLNREIGSRASVIKHRMWCMLRDIAPSWARTTTRDTSTVQYLTNIDTVEVISVRDDPGTFRFCTLLIFNISLITELSLPGRSHIPVQHLSATLHHLAFPALRQLTVETDGIEPTVLRGFLLRHTQLKIFRRSSPSLHPEIEPTYLHLIHPPIAHPSLTHIQAKGAENINRIMECLHSSPLLGSFYFESKTGVIELNSAFRLLSHRSMDGELELWLSSTDGERDSPFMDEETVEIARALHCISSVKIKCWSGRMALKTLPWLAVFPALRCVSFHLHCRANPQSVPLAEFMVRATAALSHVPDVQGEEH
ncbi:hypothetical protein B0H17DRAFT_1040130 [Mycena rosella]|uniref:F-box domain-containing protein n=1 Tax=Mycena rosella TaxID=1033263 RepID=A0AAD7GRT9_MYCRO|nr:hypothetical protein B0H17DRAFT_1040130 [Mycena rosella]